MIPPKEGDANEFSAPQSSTQLSEDQKEEVMQIAVAYVEEKYGTDYSVNGDVEIGSYGTSRDGILNQYTYPVASFRTPADYSQSGILVYVFVDLETGEVANVRTHWSKSFPPPSP